MSTASELCFPEEFRASGWTLGRFSFSALGRERDGVAPQIEKVPRWLFVANGVRLVTAKPVQVEVREEGDVYSAECPGLHVYASGSTSEQALDDLDQQVVHFYRMYSRLNENDVTGLAARLRGLYLKFFIAEQG